MTLSLREIKARAAGKKSRRLNLLWKRVDHNTAKAEGFPKDGPVWRKFMAVAERARVEAGRMDPGDQHGRGAGRDFEPGSAGEKRFREWATTDPGKWAVKAPSANSQAPEKHQVPKSGT